MTVTSLPADNAGFVVNSPNVQYTHDEIISDYLYETTRVEYKPSESGGSTCIATPCSTQYTFKTQRRIPKFGLMMVGWGGNNGSTVTAGILANREKLTWRTRHGTQHANYLGSVTQASTVKLGVNSTGSDVFIPFNHLLPMVSANDIVIGGWDINNVNLGDALQRASVLEPGLIDLIYPQMKSMVPLPSIYYPDFIADNQRDRANNVIPGNNKKLHLEHLRKDIREFKERNRLESMTVVWTASTERFADIIPGINDTAEHLLQAIDANHPEIAPSTLFAVAAILEKVPFINGSPQNTFVPGCVALAELHQSFIGGDDFKSGQTKIKSVLVDFLISAGIKPLAITSYNHLGNNDGKNLSASAQFRSKEISKSNVVDDMVASNNILYEKDEHPDHTVVIKYVPAVGDSKRAMDEYVSEIFLGGHNTIAMHNTCEDSLLAAPLIIDLAILAELMTRITYKTSDMTAFEGFHSVLSILSYFLKAPMVPSGAPIINTLSKQRHAMENIFRACVGLRPQNDMLLEHQANDATSEPFCKKVKRMRS